MNWLQKYQTWINEIYTKYNKKLIVELSTGFDTRTWTDFWNQNDVIKDDYIIYTKDDKEEVKILNLHIDRMGIMKEKVLNSKQGVSGITLSGIGNAFCESGSKDLLKLHLSFGFYEYFSVKHMIKDIVPF